MSFRELVIGGPRTVRKNLFRDIIVIILITLCSVTALSLYRGLSIKDQISSRIINDSSQLIQKRFIIFLAPFELSLRYLSKSVELKSIDVDLAQKDKIEKIFSPFLDVYTDIGSISIIADTGESVSLIRQKTGYQTIIHQDDKNLSQLKSQVYQGAVPAPAERPVSWPEPFISARNKSEISASIRPIKLTTSSMITYLSER